MADTPFFPMFVDLSDQKIVVAGAGSIAARRVAALCAFCRDVTVIAPRIDPALEKLEKEGTIRILRKRCEREDIYGADLVIAATDDVQVNNDLHAVCKALGIPVNVSSDRTKCDFYFPALVCTPDAVIGISSGGKDPKKTRRIRERIEEVLIG